MPQEELSSYITSSPFNFFQTAGQVVAICSGALLLIYVCVFLISLLVKRNREKKQEALRNDLEYSSMTALEKEEFQKYCISPNEQPVAVIGNRGLKQYLIKDDEIEGFSVVTNRRVYFKGSYLKKPKGGKVKICHEDCTVDNYEIKNAEIVTERPVWPLIAAGFAAVLEIAGMVFLLAAKMMGKI